MQDREIKGITTELLCQTEFIKRGFDVSVPISAYCKYDFIVDICGKLCRFQAKHSSESKSGIRFITTSSHLSTNGSVRKKYAQEDVDYFCTYFNNVCYVVPIGDVGNRGSITLALRNNWKNGHHVMIAKDYDIENQLARIINE